MSESNDPWESLSERSSGRNDPAPVFQEKGPGLAPLLDPPDWRGDQIQQLALWGIGAAIASTVIGMLCCGLLPLIGLAITIPALLMAQNDLKAFDGIAHPDLIDKLAATKKLAFAGVIVSSVGTLLGLICLGGQFGLFVLNIAIGQQQ